MYSFISIYVFRPLTAHPLIKLRSHLSVSKTVPLRQGRRARRAEGVDKKPFRFPFSVFTFISSPTLIKLKQSPSLIRSPLTSHRSPLIR